MHQLATVVCWCWVWDSCVHDGSGWPLLWLLVRTGAAGGLGKGARKLRTGSVAVWLSVVVVAVSACRLCGRLG